MRREALSKRPRRRPYRGDWLPARRFAEHPSTPRRRFEPLWDMSCDCRYGVGRRSRVVIVARCTSASGGGQFRHLCRHALAVRRYPRIPVIHAAQYAAEFNSRKNPIFSASWFFSEMLELWNTKSSATLMNAGPPVLSSRLRLIAAARELLTQTLTRCGLGRRPTLPLDVTALRGGLIQYVIRRLDPSRAPQARAGNLPC